MVTDLPRLTQPCWHCTAFDGMTTLGMAALCSRPGCCPVRAAPQAGCVCWARAAGADVEDWPPFVAPPDTGPWMPAGECFPRPPPPVVVEWAR